MFLHEFLGQVRFFECHSGKVLDSGDFIASARWQSGLEILQAAGRFFYWVPSALEIPGFL
jgi:hypothetical protein